jgi:hypothetical protein
LHQGIGILQGALARVRQREAGAERPPPATGPRPRNPLTLTRATIALAFYPGIRGGFSTTCFLSNRGEQATLRQDHAVMPAIREAVSSQRLLTAGTDCGYDPPLWPPARFFMCPSRSVCLHSRLYSLSGE